MCRCSKEEWATGEGNHSQMNVPQSMITHQSSEQDVSLGQVVSPFPIFSEREREEGETE